MSTARIFLLVIIFTVASTCGKAQIPSASQEMSQAANAFYRAYESIQPSAGIANTATLARFASSISPALDRLLADAAAAQARYSQVAGKLSPPLLEGDPFTSSFDGATSFSVGACGRDARGGHCVVALDYDNGRDKPLRWSDTVLLVQTNAGWRVDDVDFGADKGNLTDTLRGAIEAGNGAKN